VGSCFFIYHLHSAPRSRAEDEGGPLGAGLQEQASNHLKLLWLKSHGGER
jgi:hypothetical protein